MKPKFRVWDKLDKEIYEVGEIHWSRGEFDFIGDGITFKRDADEVELMQSTGLFDKNGKEIFEGDILEIQGIKMIVKFGSYKYLETSKNNGHILGILHDGLGFYVECINAADPDRISPFEPETLKESAVIGNIYENKDILEVIDEKRK